MDRGAVVAPAGCGKTRLIADSLHHCVGEQLVLTHTHAGVSALRRAIGRGRPGKRHDVMTIDSLALRVARAFPGLSGYEPVQLASGEWSRIREGAIRALESGSVSAMLSRSYAGVLVDEYQDCVSSQHALILRLAELAPCRVLADPRQAIFDELQPEEAVAWTAVASEFPVRWDLAEPHRWRAENPDLGRWLLSIRDPLFSGEPVDLAAGPAEFISSLPSDSRVGVAFRLAPDDDCTAFVLRDFSSKMHRLAGTLRGRFVVLESARCPDLIKFAQEFESSVDGAARLKTSVKHLLRWTASGPEHAWTHLRRVQDAVLGLQAYDPRRPDLQRLVSAAADLVTSGGPSELLSFVRAVEGLRGGVVVKRAELWRDLKRSLSNFPDESGSRLSEIALSVREAQRRVGRSIPRRLLGTPLLVKGLQCHNALLHSVEDFKSPESLYVALTRASRRLVIMGESPVVEFSECETRG